MRWKLLRRRLSISAPRMIVRSRLPWPFRWVVIALVFGFSAALSLWAFEFGKSIAGLDRDAKEELAQLRIEVAQLREERERATSTANTAESLLKTEKAAQEKLAQQTAIVEAENLALKRDLGFFERLLPASTTEGLSIRSLQAEVKASGQVRYQLLLMQSGKSPAEFQGRYEVTLSGLLDGKPWAMPQPGGAKALQLKQYLRVEGIAEHPPQAVVKALLVRVMDLNGGVKATQTVKL
jgi:Sec-independent protein translocase protein TatA